MDYERIEKMGVRIFDAAENPKNGSSLAAPRREARSARRRLRRRRYRVARIRNFMLEKGLLTQMEMDQLYEWRLEDLDIWLIRVNAIERKLTDREFARVLIHLAKNRGFKSNRKSEELESETGIVLNAVKENAILMQEKGYRTVAELLLLEEEKFNGRKRNRGGEYTHVVSRSDLENEIRLIFACQRKLGQSFATFENEEEYVRIWSFQRPFATKEDILNKIGTCTFEKAEKRAPKFSYTFEQFRALDKLNRLRILSISEPQRALSDDDRKTALDSLLNKKEVKYKDLRKILYLRNLKNLMNYFMTLLCLMKKMKMLLFSPLKANGRFEKR